MKEALRKDRLYEIIKTKTRFLSIMSLIALGVFVYIGLKATGPDMRTTIDDYYKSLDFQDISIQSTLGLDDKDVDIINSSRDIDVVEYGYMADYYLGSDNDVIRIYSESINLNYYKVISGRDIEKPNEILLDEKLISKGYQVGEKLEIESDEDSIDMINRKTFDIVGFIKSPEYISDTQRGKTNIGSGDVFAFGITKADNFDSSVYTIARLKYKGLNKEETYSDKYQEKIDKNIRVLKDRLKDRPEVRLSSVVNEAEVNIEEAERKLKDAREELQSSKTMLENAKSELDYGKSQLRSEKSRAAEEFFKADEQLSDGRVELKSAGIKLEMGELLSKVGEDRILRINNNIQKSKENLNVVKLKLDALTRDIEEYESKESLSEYELELLNNKKLEYNIRANDYNRNIEELNSLESELAENLEQISSGRDQLESGKESYSQGKNQISSGQEELQKSRLYAESEFTKASDEIKIGERKYQDGLKEYNEKAPEAETMIADGEKEIEKAKNDLKKIKVPKYIINSRADDSSYYQYLDNSKRIDMLSNVFPVFFFAIAALVSLTTMTRMVDEQRNFMGTLKALGYSNIDIGSKFIVYGFISCMIGVLIGSVLGIIILPKLISDAYTLPYNIDSHTVGIYSIDIILATVISLISTSGAAYFVARKDLKEKASELMRPKVPRSGARIFLERITPLWKKMSFIYKVTARNIFRYKKRMLMTVFGVAGCTALIFMGLSIKSSISGIGEKQYEDLFNYDSIALYNIEDEGNEEKYENALEDIGGIKNNLKVNFSNGNIDDKDLKYEDTLIITTSDANKINHFIKMRDRKTGDYYKLDDEGVFINEKTASVMNLKIGDSFSIEIEDEEYQFRVSGIVENYAGQYIYMTDKYYEKVINKPFKNNAYLIKAQNNSDKNMNDLSKEIMKNKAAVSMISTNYVKAMINDMLKSMDMIVYVILLCGSLLAVVVLYNLTNINVSERQRELSTIKVLGFYDKEVTAYVYRETIFLTILGILSGFIAGILLHRYVLISVEPASIMMDPGTNWFNYIISAAVTIVISLMVMYIIHNKIKKINMIESLKSVE